MHTRVGESPLCILSQLSSAVAGAACFVASIGLAAGLLGNAKSALFRPVLTISPTQFARIGSVKFDFEHEKNFAQAIAAPNLDSLVPTNIDQELKKISRLERRAKREHRIALAHVNAPASRHRAKHVLVAIHTDQVQTSQAEAIASREASPAVQAVAETEAATMQRIHLALVDQFKVAFNELSPTPVTTQIAQAVSSQVKSAADLGLDEIPEPVKVAVRSKKLSPKKQPPKQVLPAVLVAQSDGETSKTAQKKASDTIQLNAAAEKLPELKQEKSRPAAVLVNTQEEARVDALTQKAEHMLGYQDDVPPPSPDQTFQVDVSTNESNSPPPPEPEKTIPRKPEAASSHAENVPAKQETISFLGSTLILPTEYPKPKTPVGYSHPTQVASNTQTPPAAPEHPQTPKSPETLLSAHTSLSFNDTKPKPEPAPHVSFVEGFDWSREIADAAPEILTREDPYETYGQAQIGWRIVRASGHWPTVYWNRSGEVPLLKNNSLKMISLRAGAALQNEAGILIAKVPAGWTLEFSGRSEHALIYSESNQALSSDSVDQVRYYVFLNASPGAQILYLVKNGETGAVALPVFGGMLSYMDLSQPESKTIEGKLLDASGRNPRGLGGVRVQVIGSGQTTVTNGAGVFHLENVVTFGNQPLFIEAEASRGYPHRYKIDPRSGNATLFFMSEEQIHEWIGELEGGVSTESGLVIGALPNVAAAHEDQKPLPSIKSLATDPTLSPETYAMAGSGQLLVKTPLSAANSRFLGVQVPEGPAIVQITDKAGRVLWSELLVVSPRVLSVVGPY